MLEDGAPQAVRHLYLVADGSVKPLASPRVVPASPAAPTPPAPSAGRVLVLFFDEEHMDPGAFKRLQEAAAAFLKTGFRDGDVGGVLVGAKMAGNRLTSNRDELLAAVREAKPSAGAGLLKMDLQEWPRMTQAEAIRIAVDQKADILEQVAQRAAREAPAGGRAGLDYGPNVMEKARFVVGQLREPARRTLRTFGAVMNGLARVPGRKTVIFMSDGFFVEESAAAVREILAMAARVNARVYSIDAQGQNRRQQDVGLNAMAPMETGGQVPVGAYDTTEDAPNALAVDTGGFVVRNNNDFRAALADISRDTSQYYVLGYVPSNAATDGRFRRITVRVARPGLRVRARRGYVAAPAAPAPPPVAVPGAAGTPADAAAPLPAREAPTPAPGALAPSAVRPDAAKSVEALAARTSPARGKSQASEGWERYSKGDLEGAARLLSAAAAEPDAAPWVWYALGFAQLGTGSTPAAIESWEHVRRAVPEFETIWMDLADAYVQAGDAGRATAVLREASTRWPSHAEVWNALGTVQVRRGALDEALASFERAVKADAGDALGYFNLARTYELRYYKMRRFSQPEARWVANPADLAAAMTNYQQYLARGGPYEAQAREALERLQWIK